MKHFIIHDLVSPRQYDFAMLDFWVLGEMDDSLMFLSGTFEQCFQDRRNVFVTRQSENNLLVS